MWPGDNPVDSGDKGHEYRPKPIPLAILDNCVCTAPYCAEPYVSEFVECFTGNTFPI